MKRVFLILLTLLMAASMMLSACTTSNAGKGTPASSSTPSNPDPDPDPEPEPEPHTVSEKYLPENVIAQTKKHFEEKTSSSSFAELSLSNAPFAIADVFVISECAIKSVSIPVYRTLKTDSDGNFTFTLHVMSNSVAGLRSAPKKTVKISINAKEYSLSESSNVMKYITVDVSKYEIVLAENQTLAFCDPQDTIIPAYLTTASSSTAADKWKEDWGVICRFTNVGSSSLAYDRNTLAFDLELERTYESLEAYEEFVKETERSEKEYLLKVAAVKEAYKGKYLSLLGDSISTYSGITNNTSISSSMTNHRCYYRSTFLSSYDMTYWGRLQKLTDMKLCVINAWSSSKVYGGGKGADNQTVKNDNLLLRSSFLHNNSNQNPDLVIIYMGINDKASPTSIQTDSSKSSYTRNKPAGDLYVRLTDKNKTKTDNEIVAEWFKEVQDIAAKTGDTVTPGTTYNTWEASYALAIKNILDKYNNPEIFCMTLITNHHANADATTIGRANIMIRAIANYFGVGIIEQDNSEMNIKNCHIYGADEGSKINSLHLNIKGHEMTTRLIVETLYQHIQNKD